MADYQLTLSREIDARLKSKCDKLADAFVDDIGTFIYLYPFSLLNMPNSLYIPIVLTCQKQCILHNVLSQNSSLVCDINP